MKDKYIKVSCLTCFWAQFSENDRELLVCHNEHWCRDIDGNTYDVPIKKLINFYPFGCSSWVPSQDELQRVVDDNLINSLE